MANFTFKATSTTKFQKHLTERIKAIVLPRIEKAIPAITESAKFVVETFVTGDPVYRGLSGDFSGSEDGTDLQAEFGITDGKTQMEAFLKMLLETVHVSVSPKITTSGKNGIGTITVKALNEREFKNRAISEFQYPSEPTENKQAKFARKLDKQKIKGRAKTKQLSEFKQRNTHNIRWMNWVLNADRGTREMEKDLPDIRNYGIAYDLTDKQKGFSRTGRALMFQKNDYKAKKPKKNGKIGSRIKEFPYRLPDILRTDNGNFVVDIALSKKYQKRMRDVITQVIKNQMRKTNT